MNLASVLLASTAAIALGSLADRVLGDPRRMPHVVRGMGTLISVTEKRLLADIPISSSSARIRGVVLVGIVLCVVAGLGLGVLVAAYSVSVWLGMVVEALICFQCLAVKSLRDESMKVATSLEASNVEQARADVSMIVGRDTATLDEPGIIRAAVETVAENTSDGVIAPLATMLIGGGLGAVIYKAINTMDSMIGYRNERYTDFGRAAARLDDMANWLPSRTAACLMAAVAPLAKADGRSAWRIWRRDHARHDSPNSGQTEAACAGALHIQLGGPSTYGSILHDKPLIGDDDRSIQVGDIAGANRLMSATAWSALIGVLVIRLAAWGVLIYAT